VFTEFGEDVGSKGNDCCSVVAELILAFIVSFKFVLRGHYISTNDGWV
jgi:hypothetical protein